MQVAQKAPRQTPATVTLAQCAILAGGTPAPVLNVAGRPMLYWLMRELQRFGVEEFVVLAGGFADELENAVRDSAAFLPKPARLIFSREPRPLGSAGALRHAAAHLAPRFLLCNGDALFDTNLAPLLAAAASDPPEIHARRLSRKVAAAPNAKDSAGVYAVRRDILRHCPPDGSLERDVLPALAAQGLLRVTVADGRFAGTANPADFVATLHRPALILDRDGVINHDHGYVGTRDRFDWIDGALEAIRAATQSGWHVFIASNQSGVARGLYGESDVATLMEWVADEARRHGGTIDDYRVCPFHAEATVAAYRRDSDWRKPGPGMITDLMRAWSLNPQGCLLIGDQQTDLQAARRAGISARLFQGGNLSAFVAGIDEAKALTRSRQGV